MLRRTAALFLPVILLTLAPAQAKPDQTGGRGSDPRFVLIRPSQAYLDELKTARASMGDYYYDQLQGKEATYDAVKDFLAPIRYVNAPWRYAGVILSPEGSTEKMRVIENGYRIDAGLTRRSPLDGNVWAPGDTHLWITAGPKDELFGLDEHRQGKPHYAEGYLPIFETTYEAGDVTYKETVLAHKLIARYRSPRIDEAGVAAYVKITATDGEGQVGFEVDAPPVGYGFPIVPAGFRHDHWTDEHNNVYAYFSAGGTYDAAARLVRYRLKKGESAYVVFPHDVQLAGTEVEAGAARFDEARADEVAIWTRKLERGGQVEVPERVVMDAYRSLLLGDMQLSIGDELPYGMFSWYEGNGYAEALQTIAPFIEYGYFHDARRFIQPILDYPLSDTGIGLHVCANRLELAALYYAFSRDAAFIRKNQTRLVEVADYLLRHRDPTTGLVLDGYGFDLANQRVVNINTNTNGWRAVRDLGLTLEAIGQNELGEKYVRIAGEFGAEVRKAVLANIDRSTQPPFVPFALGSEKAYASLVESRASSYYNIVMPYFFESEIFPPKAASYTDTLDYMWTHQGVMAGLNRFAGHGSIVFAQDGIHPLYTWGREFEQIAAHDTRRAIYTFYSALANGYTRGTFLTGECQSTVPSESEWYRGTYLPPEPPANALLLRSLRHMLIHEYDADQDGIYDGLWLLSAAPRDWLAPGKTVELERMPSRFGPVGLKITAAATGKELRGKLTLSPEAAGKDVLLYVRGYQVTRATAADGRALRIEAMDGDSVVVFRGRAGRQSFTLEAKRLP